MATTMIKRKKQWNKPDPTEVKVEKTLKWFWKFFRKETIRLGRWIFFYQPKDNMDATLHIITLIAWLFVGYRLINQ